VCELAADTPDLLLASEAVLAAELKLVVEAVLLERTARRGASAAVCATKPTAAAAE
jgi:hypothetical protein